MMRFMVAAAPQPARTHDRMALLPAETTRGS